MSTSTDAARTAYFRDYLPLQVETPHVKVGWFDPDEWAELCERGAVPLVDRLTGWTAIELGDVVDVDPEEGPEYEIQVRFCPEVMAAATADLPMSPGADCSETLWIDDVEVAEANDDGSRDTRPIRFADNYLQLVAHVLLCEVAQAEPGQEVALHADLTHSAPAQLHELGPALMAEVELAALDAHFRSLES